MKVILTAAATLAFAASPALVDPMAAMTKAGCMACHAKDKKVIGPAFKDIAAKYKGQDVTAKLMEKVRKGGGGVWGPVPMSATGPDKIDDATLKTAIEFVLKS